MLIRILLCLSVFNIVCTSDVSASKVGVFCDGPGSSYIDPESIMLKPIKTLNNKGVQFNHLGPFEEHFLEDCASAERNIVGTPSNGFPGANILMLGEAFGRMPLKVYRQTIFANIYANDLSADNLSHLVKKIAIMKNEGSVVEKCMAGRIYPVVGDCLDLNANEQITKLLYNGALNNSMDLIICSNVIHFFDGQRLLQFFLNTYNWLKPGGRAHILCRSKLEAPRLDSCTSSGVIMIYVSSILMNAAIKNRVCMLPGLFKESWLDEAERKRAGCNITIQERTLKLFAKKMGFEVACSKTYSNVTVRGSNVLDFAEDADGMFCGLVLVKPKKAGDKVISEKDLDPNFVQDCLTSEAKMASFVANNFVFTTEAPWLVPKGSKRK